MRDGDSPRRSASRTMAEWDRGASTGSTPASAGPDDDRGGRRIRTWRAIRSSSGRHRCGSRPGRGSADTCGVAAPLTPDARSGRRRARGLGLDAIGRPRGAADGVSADFGRPDGWIRLAGAGCGGSADQRAAVDDQRLTGHPGRQVTGQEQRGAGDVVRHARVAWWAARPRSWHPPRPPTASGRSRSSPAPERSR